jgi:RNA polymerase sigma-32 factor
MTYALTANHQDLILAGPTGSLDSYIQAVTAVPVLSREDEQLLARQLTENNDLLAARQLVTSQLRFVVHIARSYSGYGLPLADLIQEGNIGLMKAVKRFDPDVGVRLISFAVHWIRAEIHEFVLKNWKQVKVATTKAQRKLFFNLRKAKKHLGWLSKNETTAIAEDLGVSEREVTEMEKRLYSRDVSFDPSPSDDEEKAYAPALYLQSHTADPASELEAEDWKTQACQQLFTAFKLLVVRSRDILQSRGLTENKTTLHKLADKYGVSAERIRQLENNAIKKLRTAVAPG